MLVLPTLVLTLITSLVWCLPGFFTVEFCFPSFLLQSTGKLWGDELRLCINILFLIKPLPTHFESNDDFLIPLLLLYVGWTYALSGWAGID